MFLPELQPWLCRRRSHHYSYVFCLPYLSFVRSQRFAARRVSGFSILSIDLNDASQKESFLADRGAARVGLLSRCVTQYLTNLVARSQSRTWGNRLVWMPAGW